MQESLTQEGRENLARFANIPFEIESEFECRKVCPSCSEDAYEKELCDECWPKCPLCRDESLSLQNEFCAACEEEVCKKCLYEYIECACLHPSESISQ